MRLRYVLESHGVTTSVLDPDGIQPERDLNTLLKSSRFSIPLAGILGEDVIFNLRGLLVETFGANLRNESHTVFLM